MKHIITASLCLTLLVLSGCSGEKKEPAAQEKKAEAAEVKKEGPSEKEKTALAAVRQIIQEQRKEENPEKKKELLLNALAKTEEGLAVSPDSDSLLQYRLYLLTEADKLEEAMTLVNALIAKKEKPGRGLLNSKHDILVKMKKYEEAIQVAMEIEQGEERKSPWRCMTVVEDYLLMNKTAEATEWLQKAVDRGFITLSYLEEKTFDPLRDSDRFKQMLKTMEANIGLNQPAKDFTVTLQDGTEFRLSEHQGKVILIDFWATWCPPCREEMPNLKKIYAAQKEKGFEIMGISLDSSEEALKEYVKKEEIPWLISFSGEAWLDANAKMYNVNSIPSVWLVDKKGVLRYFDIHGEDIEKAVLKLLAE